MEKINVSDYGFEACYYKAQNNKEKKCVILNLLFAPGSFMMKKTEKYFVNNGISVLSLASWNTKQTVPDENLVPLDYLLKVTKFLKDKGYEKIASVGLSLGAIMALYGASICDDIDLTIAISGYDVLFEGVLGRGTQYPSGHSSLTLNGKELEFQPFYLTKDEYITAMNNAKKEHGENYGRDLWENSVNKKLNEKAVIPVENIKGKIVMLSAVNDTCWDSASASKRIEKRIKEKGGKAEVYCKQYAHATHMLYPDTVPMINMMTKMAFKEAKNYYKQCKEARVDVTNQILKAVKEM